MSDGNDVLEWIHIEVARFIRERAEHNERQRAAAFWNGQTGVPRFKENERLELLLAAAFRKGLDLGGETVLGAVGVIDMARALHVKEQIARAQSMGLYERSAGRTMRPSQADPDCIAESMEQPGSSPIDSSPGND